MTELIVTCIARHGHETVPTTGLPLCEPHLEAAERDVRSLVYDYVDLTQALVPGTSAGQKVSGTRDAPVPLSLPADELLRAIHHTAVTWVEVAREHAGLPPAPDRGVRAGWAVQRAVLTLAPRVRLLAALPATAVWPDGPDGPPAEMTGAEGLLALGRLHQRARHMLGRTRMVEELLGECPACGLDRVLRREYGSDTVHCAGCGHIQTWDDYQRYVKLVTWGSEAA